MSKTIIIDRDTPIIIFGAGFTGYHYYEILKENDMKVSCFLDWNADKLNPKNEIGILKPDDPRAVKNGSIVIIGLSNVFEHRAIVEQLSGIGYSFFIYYDSMDKIKKDMYECFLRGESLMGKEITQYCSDDDAWEKDFVIDGEEIITRVPFEIIYVASELKYAYLNEEKSYFMDRKGKPIFGNSMISNLYLIFEKGFWDQKDFDTLKQVETYKRAMEEENYQADLFETQFSKWLQSRYVAWQMMTRELMYGSSFFYEAAPKIVRTNKGVFEERDGNNRAAFFMAKCIYRMPYRMSRSDYELWVNRKELSKVSDYIKKKHISKLRYPITHPYFYSFEIQREIYAPKRLSAIYNYLAQKKWNANGKVVLDINGKVGYYASFFEHMGAESIAIEDEKNYADLIILLNGLLGWKVEVKSFDEYMKEKKTFDLVIFSKDNEVSIRPEFKDFLLNGSSTGLFLELGYDEACDVKNDKVLQKKFEISTIIEEMVEDTILTTLVLWRKR